MQKLPLDYKHLHKSWLNITENFDYNALQPRNWPVGLLAEKIDLMKKIINVHSDTLPCDNCRKCCTEFPFACRTVEFFLILEYLSKKCTGIQQKYFFQHMIGNLKEDGSNKCPFLIPEGCFIYEARPLLCRTAIAGQHICNKYSREFASHGDWSNHPQVIIQITAMNLVHYSLENKVSTELAWPLNGERSLSIAPFEIWFLMLIGEFESISLLLNEKSYRPLLKWTNN